MGMETEEYKMPVTIEALAIHRGLKMVDDHYTGEDIAAVGLAIMGGCCRCAATIAAYSAYPSKNGYWMCGDCIQGEGEEGYATVEEANKAIFGVEAKPSARYAFTGDELATILHALRIVQDIRRNFLNPNQDHSRDCLTFERHLCHLRAQGFGIEHNAMVTACDHFAPDWKPLTDEEIDALCERINPLDAEAKPADAAELREAIAKWREASDGDSNDAEHDAGFELAEAAEEFLKAVQG